MSRSFDHDAINKFVEIRESTIEEGGEGVFALKDFKKGEVVCSLGGYLIDSDEAKFKPPHNISTFEHGSGFKLIGDGEYGDLGYKCNSDHPLNENIKQNARYDLTTKRTIQALPSIRGVFKIRAISSILKDEEIIVSYGAHYWNICQEWDAGIRPSKSDDTKLRERRARTRGKRAEGFASSEELSDSDLDGAIAAIDRACGNFLDLTGDSDIDEDVQQTNSSSSTSSKPARKAKSSAKSSASKQSASASAKKTTNKKPVSAKKATKQPASASAKTAKTANKGATAASAKTANKGATAASAKTANKGATAASAKTAKQPASASTAKPEAQGVRPPTLQEMQKEYAERRQKIAVHVSSDGKDAGEDASYDGEDALCAVEDSHDALSHCDVRDKEEILVFCESCDGSFLQSRVHFCTETGQWICVECLAMAMSDGDDSTAPQIVDETDLLALDIGVDLTSSEIPELQWESADALECDEHYEPESSEDLGERVSTYSPYGVISAEVCRRMQIYLHGLAAEDIPLEVWRRVELCDNNQYMSRAKMLMEEAVAIVLQQRQQLQPTEHPLPPIVTGVDDGAKHLVWRVSADAVLDRVLKNTEPQLPTVQLLPPIVHPQEPTEQLLPPIVHPQEPTVHLLPPIVHPQEPTVHLLPPIVHPQEPTVHLLPPIVHPQEPTVQLLPPIVHPQEPTVQPLLPIVHPQEPTVHLLLPIVHPQEPTVQFAESADDRALPKACGGKRKNKSIQQLRRDLKVQKVEKEAEDK